MDLKLFFAAHYEYYLSSFGVLLKFCFIMCELYVHLMTTSKNLFQSAGLNLLRHIARPLISLIILFWTSYSFSYFFSFSLSLTSSKHFSIRL